MSRGKVDSLQKKIDNDASPVHCLRYNSIGYLHQSAHRMAVKQVCTMSHCQGVSLNFFLISSGINHETQRVYARQMLRIDLELCPTERVTNLS